MAKKAKKAKKEPAAILGSLDAVDAALAEIGRCDAAQDVASKELEERIRVMREGYARIASPLAVRAFELRASVEASAIVHEEWFKPPSRSVALAHGRISWRKSTFIRLVRSIEFVVAALKSRKLFDAIIVNERPNKDVLAAYDDETLAAVGAKRGESDEFRIDLKEETATPVAAAEPAV